eukprot:UN02152
MILNIYIILLLSVDKQYVYFVVCDCVDVYIFFFFLMKNYSSGVFILAILETLSIGESSVGSDALGSGTSKPILTERFFARIFSASATALR